MNALMTCLLASAAATIGSRWWLLALATQQRLPGWTGSVVVSVSAAAAAALSAGFGATIAAQYRGPGMLLLLAIALGLAGLGLAWPTRPLSDRLRESITGPVSAFILLAAAMLSDGAPFIILAVAAWTGSAALAAVGGAAGLIGIAVGAASLVPVAAPMPRGLPLVRAMLATVLIIIALVCAVQALGIG